MHVQHELIHTTLAIDSFGLRGYIELLLIFIVCTALLQIVSGQGCNLTLSAKKLKLFTTLSSVHHAV